MGSIYKPIYFKTITIFKALFTLKMLSSKFLLFLFTILCWGCSPKSSSQQLGSAEENNAIQQGITGQVLWFEGDLMPKVVPEGEKTPERNQGKPVKRKIFVYELTHNSQTQKEGRFIKEVSTNLIKSIQSNEEGYFSVSLNEGQYSLFVKEDEGLYANRFDGQGNINPVKVFKDSVTNIKFRIDYKAVY